MADWTKALRDPARGVRRRAAQAVREGRRRREEAAGQGQAGLRHRRRRPRLPAGGRQEGLPRPSRGSTTLVKKRDPAGRAVRQGRAVDQGACGSTPTWARSSPPQPLWKDRLKLATRRVRLLALYTPDVLKSMQESEVKEREEVDALLQPDHPADHPADDQAATKTDDENDSFKIDWHETLTRRADGHALGRPGRRPTRTTTATSASATSALGGLNGLRGRRHHQGPGKGVPQARRRAEARPRSWPPSTSASPPTRTPAAATEQTRPARHADEDQGGQPRHGRAARRSAGQRVRRRRVRRARPVQQHDLAERRGGIQQDHPGRVQRRGHPDPERRGRQPQGRQPAGRHPRLQGRHQGRRHHHPHQRQERQGHQPQPGRPDHHRRDGHASSR